MASTPTQDLQNEVLITVRKSQESVIDALKTWVETVQSITPKVPAVDMPFADKLPKPEEVVASAYDFAEQPLASQRTFAEEVLKAISGALNVSAETLMTQAGLIDAIAGEPIEATDGEQPNVPGTEAAIAADPRLGQEQKAALIAVYRSMLASAPPPPPPAPAP